MTGPPMRRPGSIFGAALAEVYASAALTRPASAAGRAAACRWRARPRWRSPPPRGPASLRRRRATLVRPVDQLHRDLRHVRHGQDRIARPVARLDAVLVEPHLLVQRPARRLDDAAFDLVLQPVRIDDQPGIGRGPDARHRDLAARAIDLDLGDAPRRRSARFLYCAKPMPRPRLRLPASPGFQFGHRGHLLDHGLGRAGPSDARGGTPPDRPSRSAASSSMKDSIANTLA